MLPVDVGRPSVGIAQPQGSRKRFGGFVLLKKTFRTARDCWKGLRHIATAVHERRKKYRSHPCSRSPIMESISTAWEARLEACVEGGCRETYLQLQLPYILTRPASVSGEILTWGFRRGCHDGARLKCLVLLVLVRSCLGLLRLLPSTCQVPGIIVVVLQPSQGTRGLVGALVYSASPRTV